MLIDQRHLGVGGQGGIVEVGSQAVQTDDGDQRAVEPPRAVHRALRGQQGRLVAEAVGGADNHRRLAVTQPGEPAAGPALGIIDHGGRCAGHPPQGVKAGEIVVAGDAVGDFRQPLSALKADRLRGEGLQQHAGALHLGAGHRGAAIGRQGQVGALFVGVLLKGEARLNYPQQQHGEQRQGHRHPQTDADCRQRPPNKGEAGRVRSLLSPEWEARRHDGCEKP